MNVRPIARAPISRRPSRRRGVTLIETLVVVGLIALFAAVVVLNAPPPRAGARTEAERFAARLDAAFVAATGSGSPLRLDIDRAGYRFSTYADGKWTAAAGRLAPAAFDRTVAVSVVGGDPATRNDARRGDGDEKDDSRSVVIDPLGGDAGAFAFEGGGARWVVTLDALGAVKVARDGR